MIKQFYKSLCFASVFFLVLGGSVAQAQTSLVTGKIQDESGQVLPGVNVIKKGTTSGTSTDANGNFSVEATSDDVLVFSFIGYQSQEVPVGSQSRINITLVEDIATLQEVVVIGYGEMKKSDLTGAVASVSQEQLRGSTVANLDQALQGRIAGVQITQNSGAPGGATTVNIRGISSVSGSNQPLYVIDGIQFQGDGGMIAGFTDGGNGQTRVNPLSGINPNDIASIDVLKDASATAIYGSRASNGVIIITTKRGKAGESKITYNGQYGVASIRKKLDMMDLPEYAAYRNEIATETNTVPDNRLLDPTLLGPGTDWQDEIFRTAVQQNHSLTVSGGSEKTQFAVMGGYFKQEGVAINSDLKRFSTRINIDSKINDWFKLGTSLSYANTFENIINDGSGDGVFSQALAVSPDVPVRNTDGTYAGPPQGQNSAEVRFNPVAVANLRTNTLARQRLSANSFADITLLKNLVFRTEYGFDNNQTQNISFSPTYRWGSLINTENQLQDRRETMFNWIWKNYVTYNLTLAGGHDISAMVGTEAIKNEYQNIYVLKKNLATNDLHVLSQGDNVGQTTNGAKNSNTLSSYFARVNYNFKDRYLITATLRNDGSSRFGPANKRGFFPSASVAWRLSNESFMPESSFFSDIKIRGGYGEVGNQGIPNYAYGSALVSVNSPFGTTYKLDRLANPNVKWEAGTQTNIGLDLSLMEGRINLTADVYKRGTKDFLIEQPIPLYLGGGASGGVFAINAPYVNLGQIENKGIDLSLNTHNIRTDNFSWETDATFTIARNEIQQLDNSNVINSGVYLYGVYTVPTRSQVGKPVGQFYGFVTDGIFKTEEEILAHAAQVPLAGSETSERPNGINYVHRNDGVWLGDVKFKDLNNDGIINADDQTFIGNPNPDFTFGFNNHFKYKAFSLGIFITGSYGGDIFNASKIRTEGMQSLNNNQAATVTDRARVDLINPTGTSQDALDREDITKVRLSNPDATLPRFSATRVNGNDRIASDRWIEDGSYLRIQNISLGYSLPSSLTQRAKISAANIYVNIQNMFVFTNYSNFDPEVGANNQNALQQSVDTGRYPTPQLITMGIDLTF